MLIEHHLQVLGRLRYHTRLMSSSVTGTGNKVKLSDEGWVGCLLDKEDVGVFVGGIAFSFQ